jgi:hypothetical protein
VAIHYDSFYSTFIEILVDYAFEASFDGFLFAVSWDDNGDCWVEVAHLSSFLSTSIDLTYREVGLITFSQQNKTHRPPTIYNYMADSKQNQLNKNISRIFSFFHAVTL